METIRVHSRNGRFLAAIATATTIVIVGQMAIAGQWTELMRYSGWLGLAQLFVWAALWSPYVESSPGGVQMQNVLSVVTVPWPAIEDIEGKYGLTLVTAYGKFTAWSASRPRMRAMADESDIDPATAVKRTWLALQKAGHLDNPRLEPDAQPQRWRLGVIELTLALAAWTAIAAFLI